MINNEIVNYIKSELSRGESKQEVMDSLIKNGWGGADVQEAFNSLSSLPVSASATKPQHTAEIATEKNYPITKLWIFKGPIIAACISIVALFFGIWFPYLVIAIPFWLIGNPLIRSRFHYSTGEKFFDIQQGVFSKKQRHLPYGVIQTVVVKQDWFDRIFGLASLAVEDASQGGGKGFFGGSKSFKMSGAYQQQGETLGSSGNKVSIPGLKKENAESLKLVILQRMKENPIEELGL
jgi:membrane protein YdbS with pleckstrin-like domain